MKKFIFLIVLVSLIGIPNSHALEFNLFKVEAPDSGKLSPIGTPREANQLAKVFGKSFGFPLKEIAPAMLGPVEEAPSILRIAQAAGTAPLSVWMLRKAGMSHNRPVKIKRK